MISKKAVLFSAAIICCATSSTLAQVELDKELRMTGSSNEDRQITGVGNPEDADHAVNAGTIQAGSLIYAPASGAVNAYVVTLSPAVTTYTIGMMVNFKANAANTGAATLNLGPGVRTIKKQVTADLAANDIKADQLVTVVYDGTNFQMVSASGNSSAGPAPCPSGFTNVNNNYCIEPNERAAVNWVTAHTTCAALGTGVRLCDQIDFYYACTQAGTLSLTNMSNNEEWAHGQDNGNPGMKTTGSNGSCSAMAWQNISTTRNFRCCFYR